MELRQTIWNLMGEERRLAAARTFWENPEQKGAQRQVELALAQRLHARPVFIKKLPAEKKAGDFLSVQYTAQSEYDMKAMAV